VLPDVGDKNNFAINALPFCREKPAKWDFERLYPIIILNKIN